MKKTIILSVLSVLCLLILTTPSHADSKDLVVLFSGDTAGAIEPCGCSPRKGGIARRAAFIEKIRKENKNVLAVDCGDMFLKNKKPGELRAKTIATAMGIMKYDAINVGDYDLGFGKQFFTEIGKKNALPFVSANISLPEKKIKNEGNIIQPYKIINLNGIKIGITGITPAIYFTDEAIKKEVSINRDMNGELQKVLSEMNKKADFSILLSHLGDDATKNYLEMNDLEKVFVAIAGHGRHLSFEPRLVKNTYMVQNSMSGESIGVLKIHLNEKNIPESCTLENITLSLEMPEDPQIAKLIKDFDAEAIKIEESERNAEAKKEEEDARKKVLSLSPDEFMEKMKKSKDGTVPIE